MRSPKTNDYFSFGVLSIIIRYGRDVTNSWNFFKIRSGADEIIVITATRRLTFRRACVFLPEQKKSERAYYLCVKYNRGRRGVMTFSLTESFRLN